MTDLWSGGFGDGPVLKHGGDRHGESRQRETPISKLSFLANT